jgi:acetolactate synthase-1/2/3 large subunit
LPDNFAPEVQLLARNVALDIVRMLGEARRPLVIVPPALCTRLGKAAQARLAVLGVPIIPMESPRGAQDPALGALRSVLQQADLVLLLGKQLDFTLSFGTAVAGDCRWVVVDPEEVLLNRARRLLRPALAVQAEPLQAIDALVAAARDGLPVDPGWPAVVREAVSRRWRPDSTGKLDSAMLCASIGSFLAKQDDAILISDGGEIGQWALALASAPDRLINGVAGAIGPGIPFAIGAKMAAPHRKVLAVMGDGTFGFHMAEFETAVRYGAPFVAVIGNDGRWNAEYQIQIRNYGVDRSIGCELGSATRYEKVVEALGGYGVLVERAADVEPALHEAFASKRPACVNVMIEGLPAPTFKA